MEALPKVQLEQRRDHLAAIKPTVHSDSDTPTTLLLFPGSFAAGCRTKLHHSSAAVITLSNVIISAKVRELWSRTLLTDMHSAGSCCKEAQMFVPVSNRPGSNILCYSSTCVL